MSDPSSSQRWTARTTGDMTDRPYTTKADQTLLRAFIGAASATTAILLASCAGYTPGEKAYWDAKVREMCARDGGLQIFQKWRLTRQEAEVFVGPNGRISVPVEGAASPVSPVYAVMTKEYLRRANPEVHRTEVTIVRRTDKTVLGKWVAYGRVGGDFPSHAHPSSFGCPDIQKISSDVQQIFVIEETVTGSDRHEPQ